MLYYGQPNLYRSMTFDAFIQTKANRSAYEKAYKAAKNETDSPVFIFQGAFGKTHILNAIGNYIDSHTDRNVLYLPSRKVEFDIYDYSQVNVLIIDDIDRLDEKGQNSVRTLVDQFMMRQGRQVFLSLKKPVTELTPCLAGFVLAFDVVYMPPLDEELKQLYTLRIVQRMDGFSLSNEMIRCVASKYSRLSELDDALQNISLNMLLNGIDTADLNNIDSLLKAPF